MWFKRGFGPMGRLGFGSLFSRGTMIRRKPTAISVRAAVVRRPGQHIGFFELVVWSWLRRVRVMMLYGRNIVDVRAWFGAALSGAGVGGDPPDSSS
jgi:hypothetical protein